MAAIRDAIASAKPEIVFVALSFPKGERLIAELRPGFRGIWWIGVGISGAPPMGRDELPAEGLHTHLA